MGESKYNKVLTMILIIIGLLILLMLGYLGYQYYKKHTETVKANEFLEEFDALIVELNKKEENSNNPTEGQTTTPSGTDGISTDKLVYRGYNVIGKIELSSVNLQYPILDTVTVKSIEVSVAMQYGVGLNKVGNTVIIGHNYRNGLFFGSNRKMQIGDEIYITDLEGNRIKYVIYDKYLTSQEDTTYLTRDTQGTREITLVTCHSDNKYRLVIKAREQK